MFWYAAEIEARQEYYKILYDDRFKFINCNLEEVVTQQGAEELLSKLEIDAVPMLPLHKNKAENQISSDLEERLTSIHKWIAFDPKLLARSEERRVGREGSGGGSV